MSLVGKKLFFDYESGLQVIGDYTRPAEVWWEAITGPAKGSRGTESVNAAEIAPGIFLRELGREIRYDSQPGSRPQ